MTIACAHEADQHRYTLSVDGELACVIDYKANDQAISMTRTFTVPTFRRQGLANQLVEFAVNDIEANDTRRVIAMCWYVTEWFNAHPERRALLSR